MKKNRLKNLLKCGILLFGILFNISCQKEDLTIPTEPIQEKKIKFISLNELNLRIGDSDDYNKLSKLFNTNKEQQLQRKLEDSDNPWIITDEIAMIEKETVTYYTFKIGSNSIENEFYNLIVTIDNLENILSMRILEYIPSDIWLEDNSLPFSGQVKLTENEIFTSNNFYNLIAQKGFYQCITDVTITTSCNLNGEGHYDGHPACTDGTSWNNTGIEIQYGTCYSPDFSNDSNNFPIGTGNNNGNGGSGGTVSNPNDNCVPSIDNPCPEDETTILLPIKQIDDDECSISDEDFNAPYSENSPFNVDLSLVRASCDNIDTIAVAENEKFMCIYNKLAASPKFKDLFIDTFGESENLDVKFEVTDEEMESAHGRTLASPITTNGVTDIGLITIKIRKSDLDNSSANTRTPFLIAKTILHEAIHAFLIVKLYNCNSGASIDELNNSQMSELIEEYHDGSCIVDQGQHEFMFDFMVPTMEQILSEIKDDIIPVSQQEFLLERDYYSENTPDNPFSESHPFDWNEFYHFISIQGLHESQSVIDYLNNNPINQFLYNGYNFDANSISKNCN